MTAKQYFLDWVHSHYTYSPEFNFTAEGQELTQYVKFTQDPFVLNRIDVNAYKDDVGNIMALANSPLPPDQFLIMIENTTTGKRLFDTSSDISEFVVSKSDANGNNITPMLIMPLTEYKITIKHERAVDTSLFSAISSTHPVLMKLTLKGFKLLKPDPNEFS